MNETQSNFWFPAKSYGWGWGAPVKWQGWFVLAVWFAIILAAGVYFRPKLHPIAFFATVAAATALLVVVAFIKGEKPLAWRWGKKQ